MHLVTTSTYNASATAYNISGEIPGATDEVVLVSGHLDSWDTSTCAQDDGSGIAVTIAAAKLAASVRGQPRRTIRVVLWGSSEQDGSSTAYVAAHRNEISKIIVAGESDAGSDAPYAAAVPKGALNHPAMRAYAAALAELRVTLSKTPSYGDGSDTAGLVEAGTPSIDMSLDVSRYMPLHHSADDTLDKVNPETLAVNVANWASFIHAVAYSDIDFRKLLPKVR